MSDKPVLNSQETPVFHKGDRNSTDSYRGPAENRDLGRMLHGSVALAQQ